jgi:hypothetical protein
MAMWNPLRFLEELKYLKFQFKNNLDLFHIQRLLQIINYFGALVCLSESDLTAL